MQIDKFLQVHASGAGFERLVLGSLAQRPELAPRRRSVTRHELPGVTKSTDMAMDGLNVFTLTLDCSLTASAAGVHHDGHAHCGCNTAF